MRKLLALALTTSFVIAGCASTGSDDKAGMAAADSSMAADSMAIDSPVAQAEADLAAAIEAHGQWRVIDKATGSKAVNLTDLMKVAKEKAEAGETEEANRIAAHISKAAKIGTEQAARYAGATPYYN